MKETVVDAGKKEGPLRGPKQAPASEEAGYIRYALAAAGGVAAVLALVATAAGRHQHAALGAGGCAFEGKMGPHRLAGAPGWGIFHHAWRHGGGPCRWQRPRQGPG